MADYKISQLTTVTPPPAGALVPIVDVTDTTTVPAGPGGSNKAMLAGLLSMSRVASTFSAGYALVNGTGTVISWAVPNDGALHRATVFALIHVTSAETGGLISLTYTGPFGGATLHTSTLIAAGLGTDTAGQTGSFFQVIVGAGTTVSVTQGSALSVGAATLYAEIWGS